MSTDYEIIDGDLRFTRVFDAPRELVFAAWTDPERVQVWWGCAQTTSVASTVELRVGGAYRHVMQVEGAGEVVLAGEFTEVDPPRKLSYRVQGGPVEGMEDLPDTTTTVEFLERGDQTELRLTISGLSESQFKDIVTGGWRAGLAKLEGALVTA